MPRKPARPQWGHDDEGRVRVLLECEARDSPTIIASLVERHGFDVRVCEGPEEAPCDLVCKGSCELVDGADVVVNLLRGTDPDGEILDEVAGMRRPPAVVTTRSGDAPAPEHVVTIPDPVTRRALIHGISEALVQRDRPPAWWGDGYP